MGAINWAGVVPRAEDSGVRLDRCGFGWGLRASLHNYGTSFGARGSAGYIEACDLRGAALPLPYATGAGYIFSAALLRWVATDPKVVGWVAEAAGPEREALQWQKYEDTTTGYWLTHSPEPVEYVRVRVRVRLRVGVGVRAGLGLGVDGRGAAELERRRGIEGLGRWHMRGGRWREDLG